MHVFHVGYVGLMGNIHYAEILDCLVGWFGADLSKDDGGSLDAEEPGLEARRPVEPPAPQPTTTVREASPLAAPEAPPEKAPTAPTVRVVRVRKSC